MHPVAAGTLPVREPCTASARRAAAQFELCIGQYVVHPLNHDDLQLSLDALSMPARVYVIYALSPVTGLTK